MSKVLAYYPLHYGSEYLKESILSIVDHVEQIVFLYTERPSYGQSSNIPNPDSRDTLLKIAWENCKGKMEWIDIDQTSQENNHRNLVFGYEQGFDLIMAVDADEIWDNLPEAIEAALATKARHINVAGSQWVHFWRSFDECNRDGFAPTRFHCVNFNKSNATIHCGNVYHMGYAQSERITEYKISVHGHKSILQSWFKEKFKSYEKGVTRLIHPDSQTVWVDVEKFDKTTLPKLLKEHPNYNVERIQ